MKSISSKLITRIFLLLVFFGLYNCNTPKKIVFEETVDTSDKKISYQIKKTFGIESMGVWISNEFEGARLNGVTAINDSTIVVKILPENQPVNKSPYYAFMAWADEAKSIYIQFDYPEGFEHRYWPKIKKNGSWNLVDSASVKLADPVTVKLDLQPTPQILSAQEVNSSRDVRKWFMDSLMAKSGHIRLKSAGKSVRGRDLPVLDIYRGDPEGKDIIILLTRQHPPEITGYFAFKTFLETIVDPDGLSEKFLNKYRILAFPIVNPDGVDLGHWRHNARGVDTNRDWAVFNQPEIKNVVKFITKTAKRDKGNIILGLDFHSTYEDIFYTNELRKGTDLPDFTEDWFRMLEERIPEYKVNEAAGNSTKPVSKAWFLYSENAVGITYEIGDATSRARINEIGKNSAEAMMELLLEP